jgi:hypothetical protein
MITLVGYYPKAIEQVCNDIDATYQHWYQTGIFVLPRPFVFDGHSWRRKHDKGIKLPASALRNIVNRAAKELKRPIITYKRLFAVDADNPPSTKWRDRTYLVHGGVLEIKGRKYLSPIINPLMLVAKRHYEVGQDQCPLVVEQTPTKLYFRFYDTELLDSMLENFRTREEMRAALKLPT